MPRVGRNASAVEEEGWGPQRDRPRLLTCRKRRHEDSSNQQERDRNADHEPGDGRLIDRRVENKQGEQDGKQENERRAEPPVPEPSLDGCSQADHSQTMVLARVGASHVSSSEVSPKRSARRELDRCNAMRAVPGGDLSAEPSLA